jgi:hypothetical protein
LRTDDPDFCPAFSAEFFAFRVFGLTFRALHCKALRAEKKKSKCVCGLQ